MSALPETWLGLLLQRAEDDPEMSLVQVAKEEEAIGVAAGIVMTPYRDKVIRPGGLACLVAMLLIRIPAVSSLPGLLKFMR